MDLTTVAVVTVLWLVAIIFILVFMHGARGCDLAPDEDEE